MRIFIAGATGLIGRRLVRLLANGDHTVIGTTSSPARAGEITRAGGQPVVLDALNRKAVFAALEATQPEVVIHQLTRLNPAADFKRLDRDFETTNQLRTRAVDYLLAAARQVGAERFLAQSFTGWTNARTGGPAHGEEHPLDPDPAPSARQTLAAIAQLEEAVTSATGITGIVLRYGLFYGPGTAISADGEVVTMVRRRRIPIVGNGGGVWSFVHIDDVAQATVAALASPTAHGRYNVVDDEPARVADWLPYLAQVVGARPPRRVPVWLARPLLGEQGIRMMTEVRGSRNTRARQELGWEPRYPSWRVGFRDELAPTPAGAATS